MLIYWRVDWDTDGDGIWITMDRNCKYTSIGKVNHLYNWDILIYFILFLWTWIDMV